jgi:hypothetical protein
MKLTESEKKVIVLECPWDKGGLEKCNTYPDIE